MERVGGGEDPFAGLSSDARLALARVCLSSGDERSARLTLRAEDIAKKPEEQWAYRSQAKQRIEGLMEAYDSGNAREKSPGIGAILREAVEAAEKMALEANEAWGEALGKAKRQAASAAAKSMEPGWFEAWALGSGPEDRRFPGERRAAALAQIGKPGFSPDAWAEHLKSYEDRAGYAEIFSLGRQIAEQRESDDPMRLLGAARIAQRLFGPGEELGEFLGDMAKFCAREIAGGLRDERNMGEKLEIVARELLSAGATASEEFWPLAGYVAIRGDNRGLWALAMKEGGRLAASAAIYAEIAEYSKAQGKTWQMAIPEELTGPALRALRAGKWDLSDGWEKWLEADPPKTPKQRACLLEALARGGWDEIAESFAKREDWEELARERPGLLSDLIALDSKKLSLSGPIFYREAKASEEWEKKALYFAERLSEAGAKTRATVGKARKRSPKLAAFLEAAKLQSKALQAKPCAPEPKRRGM